MRLTFRADRCATFAEAADWAAAGGYDGLELRLSFDASDHVATNAGMSAAGNVRRALGPVAVSSVLFTVGELPSVDPAAGVSSAIDAAGQLGAAVVRVVEPPGRPLPVEALRRLGDRAEAANVAVAVEVGRAAGSAVATWHRLDAAGHPAVGCGWGTDAADDPAVAVPTLNSRIYTVRLTRSPADPDVRRLLHRLAGIGYAGWLSVDWIDEPDRGAVAEAARQLRG